MRILRMDSTTGACAEFELDSDGVFTFIEGDQSLIKDTDHVLLPGSDRVCVLSMNFGMDFIEHCIHISAMQDHQYLNHTQGFKPKHSLARNPRFVSKGNPFKTQMRSVNRNR